MLLLSDVDKKKIDFNRLVVLAKGFGPKVSPHKDLVPFLKSKIHKHVWGNQQAINKCPMIQDDTIIGSAMVPVVRATFDQTDKCFVVLVQKKSLNYLSVPCGMMLSEDENAEACAHRQVYNHTGLRFSYFEGLVEVASWKFPHEWGGLPFAGSTKCYLGHDPLSTDELAHIRQLLVKENKDVVEMECKRGEVERLVFAHTSLFKERGFAFHKELDNLKGMYLTVVCHAVRKLEPPFPYLDELCLL